MLNDLTSLYQTLKSYTRQLRIKHADTLMSVCLQLELPFMMASETTYLPLRIAQRARAARTAKYSIKGN